MNSTEVLADGFGRVKESFHDAIEGLTPEELRVRLDDEANTIGWLAWHLARVQDDHVAAVAGTDQVYTTAGWSERFGLPIEDGDIGYGHDPDQVALVRTDSETLLGYFDAVHDATIEYISTLEDSDLEEVVDTRWNPPVTLGVRLVSVISDDLQHVGQAAIIRGIVKRR
jgi:uncharacterized damage-inducible protein DinB